MELPQISPDEEMLAEIVKTIKEGQSIEMLSSGVRGEVPPNMSMTLAVILLTGEPLSFSMSRKNTRDRNSPWRLRISPPDRE